MSYQTQQYSEPLFKDIIWSRPEQKSLAGKLLILGGNLHAISAPSEAYNIAVNQGIGEVKVVLPDKTKKLLGPKISVDIELAASNPSGSFSIKAQDDIYNYVSWSDAILLAGDFGRNSETSILLENIAQNMLGLQIYTRDAADYFLHSSSLLVSRNNTLLVISIAQLQKYCLGIKWPVAVTYNMGLEQLCSMLGDLTAKYPAFIVTQYFTNIITAANGRVIATKLPSEPAAWRLKTAAAASVWWLQNPSKPLQAISSSITQLDW